MSNAYSKGTTLPRQEGTDEDPREANMSTATASTPIRAKAPAWAEVGRQAAARQLQGGGQLRRGASP
jgi:hypothetical protein